MTRQQQIAAAADAGETVADIAARLGIAEVTVRTHLRRAGAGTGYQSKITLEDAVAAVAKHGSNRAAARALGVTEGAIRYRLRRAIPHQGV